MIMIRKRVVYSIVIVLVVVFVYASFNTKLCADPTDNYTFTKQHNLKSNEILFGIEGFNHKGILPIYISKIEILSEMKNASDFEVKVFYPNQQKTLLSAGQIEYEEFLSYYDGGKDLKPINSIGWLKDNRFEDFVITREEKIERTWVKIEYRVCGIFKKTVISAEMIM